VNYKLLCLDVDGTLGHPKSGGDFRQTADDWEFFPGRVEFCRDLVGSGAKIITVSNQGGVCFPWSKFSEEEIRAVLAETARQIGAMASLVACSIMHPKALERYRFEDPRRKPAPGMILEAKELAGVSLDEILMVGDRPEDEQAARAAGVAFQWAHEFFA
jgi:D-glycero-D-manno-heptose 1,7-bisphosphate phosphatase